MADFAKPYDAYVPERKMTKEEVFQAIRLDLASELEAAYLYQSLVMATDDPVVKRVLSDIRDEEKEHFGELMALMRYLDPNQKWFWDEGEGEVVEMLQEMKGIDEAAAKKIIDSVTPVDEDDAPEPSL